MMRQEHSDQHFGKIFAAQEVVTGNSPHFHDVSRVFQDRDIECAAPQIEDQIFG